MKKSAVALVIVVFFLQSLSYAGPNENAAKQSNPDNGLPTASLADETGVSKEYLAEQKVKMLPSRHGDTIDSYMTNMARIPMAEDLGWQVYPIADGYEVERSILIKNSKIIRYKWKVSHSGEVSPVDDKSRSLMK